VCSTISRSARRIWNWFPNRYMTCTGRTSVKCPRAVWKVLNPRPFRPKTVVWKCHYNSNPNVIRWLTRTSQSTSNSVFNSLCFFIVSWWTVLLYGDRMRQGSESRVLNFQKAFRQECGIKFVENCGKTNNTLWLYSLHFTTLAAPWFYVNQLCVKSEKRIFL
jgi:hypothetical protein